MAARVLVHEAGLESSRAAPRPSSDFLSVLEVPAGKELQFYASLGFVAGFNERFAQDMLAAAAPQPASTPQPDQAGANAPKWS
jgi:hypothetical protein